MTSNELSLHYSKITAAPFKYYKHFSLPNDSRFGGNQQLNGLSLFVDYYCNAFKAISFLRLCFSKTNWIRGVCVCLCAELSTFTKLWWLWVWLPHPHPSFLLDLVLLQRVSLGWHLQAGWPHLPQQNYSMESTYLAASPCWHHLAALLPLPIIHVAARATFKPKEVWALKEMRARLHLRPYATRAGLSQKKKKKK